MKIAHRNTIKKGFTLIELLVVISIIAILVTLVFSVSGGLIDRARSAEASTMANSLKNGISAYQTEYRRMPLPSGVSASGEFADMDTDEDFMDIMLGIDKDENPKKISFISVNPAKKRGNEPYSGLVGNAAGGGILYDPWGARYGIRVNVQNTERLPNPFAVTPSGTGPDWGTGQSSRITDNPIINDDIIVWSQGKDEADAADNPITIGN